MANTTDNAITNTTWTNLPSRNGDKVLSICGKFTLIYVQTATLTAYIMRTLGGHLVESAPWNTCINVKLTQQI